MVSGTRWMTVAEAAEYLASESWLRTRLVDILHMKAEGKTLLHRHELDV
jgi:hypothetical protein